MRDLKGLPDVDAIKAGMFPVSVRSMSLPDGKLAGLPYYAGHNAFICNEEHLSRAGVPVPDGWDSLLDACRKLKRDGVSDAPYNSAWGQKWPELSWSLFSLWYAEGALVFDKNADLVVDAAFRRVLEGHRALYKDQHVRAVRAPAPLQQPVLARSVQNASEQVFPIDPTPDRLGRLAVAQPLAELHERDESQAPGCVGRLSELGVEVDKSASANTVPSRSRSSTYGLPRRNAARAIRAVSSCTERRGSCGQSGTDDLRAGKPPYAAAHRDLATSPTVSARFPYPPRQPSPPRSPPFCNGSYIHRFGEQTGNPPSGPAANASTAPTRIRGRPPVERS